MADKARTLTSLGKFFMGGDAPPRHRQYGPGDLPEKETPTLGHAKVTGRRQFGRFQVEYSFKQRVAPAPLVPRIKPTTGFWAAGEYKGGPLSHRRVVTESGRFLGLVPVRTGTEQTSSRISKLGTINITVKEGEDRIAHKLLLSSNHTDLDAELNHLYHLMGSLPPGVTGVELRDAVTSAFGGKAPEHVVPMKAERARVQRGELTQEEKAARIRLWTSE